jgi:protein PsiE
MPKQSHKLGRHMLKLIEYGGLIIITVATLIAGTQEILLMVGAGKVTLADLLMLFIYLEIIAMVAVYLDSGKLPIRMPLYIAIVALARYLALDIKNIDNWGVIAVAGAIFVLAAAVLLIRYGKYRYPYPEGDHNPKTIEPPQK